MSDATLAEAVREIAESIVDTSTEEGRVLLQVAERLEQEHSVREQYDRIWAAVTKDGGMQISEGWRDANFRDWVVRVGPMVECPSCAFMFGVEFKDDGREGYSCPECAYDGHVAEEWASDDPAPAVEPLSEGVTEPASSASGGQAREKKHHHLCASQAGPDPGPDVPGVFTERGWFKGECDCAPTEEEEQGQ